MGAGERGLATCVLPILVGVLCVVASVANEEQASDLRGFLLVRPNAVLRGRPYIILLNLTNSANRAINDVQVTLKGEGVHVAEGLNSRFDRKDFYGQSFAPRQSRIFNVTVRAPAEILEQNRTIEIEAEWKTTDRSKSSLSTNLIVTPDPAPPPLVIRANPPGQYRNGYYQVVVNVNNPSNATYKKVQVTLTRAANSTVSDSDDVRSRTKSLVRFKPVTVKPGQTYRLKVWASTRTPGIALWVANATINGRPFVVQVAVPILGDRR